MISKSLNKRPKVCKIKWEIRKKMLENFTTTPTLPFKQQQNIADFHETEQCFVAAKTAV
jgi:hypothetical protein